MPLAGALAAEAELGRRLEGSAPPEDGFSAAARLAWGLLLAMHGPATARGMVFFAACPCSLF